MATYDREANLIIRAQDLTSQPIGQVVGRVKGLITALEGQTKASLSGGASAQEFTKALTDLSKVADTLIRQKVALQDFGLKEDRLSSTKTVLDQRKAELEAARAALPADATKAEQDKIKGLEKAVGAAERAESRASEAFERATARLEKMGVDTFRTADAQRTLSTALLEVTSAMAKAQSADDNFTANKRRAAQYTEALTTILKEHEAALAATERAEVEETRAAKAAAAARQEAAEKEMAFANKSKANVREFDIAKTFQTADEERKAAAARMDSVRAEAEEENAIRTKMARERMTIAHFEAEEEDKRRDAAVAAEKFRQTAVEASLRATQAEAAAAAARAPVGTFGAGATAREAVAGQFASIPGRFGDLGEIKDADAAIDKLNQTIQKGGVFSSSYSQSMQQVYSIQRRIAGDAGLIDRFKEQQKAASDAESAFLKARDNVNSFATQIQRAGAPTQELAKELQGAEREMAAALKVTVAESQALEKLRAELKAASIDHTALGAATSKLTAQAKRLAETQSSVQGKETGFLGLRPYQLKNLEYQIGDIYTQLSLGQGVLRTFNSQSDQIFQLFDTSISKVRLLATYILPAAAATYVLVKALLELKNAADAMRDFNARLTANADGGKYSAVQMEATAKSLEHLGVSGKDARDAMNEFAKAGLDPSRFHQFGAVAQNLVDVFHVKFPEAIKEVTSAFTKGYEAIKKQDDQYNFLTASEREHIRLLFEEGKAEEARALALDRFTAKMGEAAKGALSDMERSIRSLSVAWDQLLISLAKTGVLDTLAHMLTSVGQAARFASGQLSWENWRQNVANIHAGISTLGVDQETMNDLQAQRRSLREQIASSQKPYNVVDPVGGTVQTFPGLAAESPEVKRLQAELLKVESQITQARAATVLGLPGAPGVGPDGKPVKLPNSEETAKASADFIRDVQLKMDAQTDRILLGPARLAADKARVERFRTELEKTAADKGAAGADVQAKIDAASAKEEAKLRRERERDEQAEADKIRSINQALADQLIAIRNKVAQADKTNVAARLQAFDEEWSKMQSTIDKAKAHGVSGPGGVSLADFQKTLEEARLQERQQIVLDSAQEIVTNTIKARKDAYGKIMDEYKGGLIDLSTAFKNTMEVTSEYGPKVADAVRKARKALTEVPATPKTEAAGVSLDRQAATDTSGTTQTKGLLRAGMEQLQEYYNVRRSVTQNEKLLVQAGAESQVEAEKNIQMAYKDTQKVILELIDKMEKEANLAHDAHTLSDADYLDLIGKLRLAKTETDYVSESQKQLKKTIEDSIVNHAVQAFDTIAQSLGNLIAGTGKWKDVLASIGQAFSQFAAGILRDIAAMIIKQELLMMIQNAMKAASTALAHGGDTVGLSMNMSRAGAPVSWASAPRMHSGGPVMGLASNEVPAVLEVGERVLSKGEARNYGKAMGAKSQGVMGVRNVLAVGDREIANAMAGAHGEKVVLSVLKRNAPTIRQWVRG